MQLFNYIFNVGGNYTATINGMTEATGDFTAKVESANNWVGKMTSILAGLDLVRNTLGQLMPLIMGVGKSISWVKGLQWASMWTGLSGTLTRHLPANHRKRIKNIH